MSRAWFRPWLTGSLIGGGVALDGGILFGGGVGQGDGEGLGLLGLALGFAAVEVAAAGVVARVGADQQAAAGAQGGAGLGGEFGAVAAVGLSCVVGLLFEVAELEPAGVLGGAQFDAGLAGAVVEDELVVAALPALAGAGLLGFEAREAGVVAVGLGAFAGEPGGGVGTGLLAAAADLVALGVGLALAVVDGADDDRAVDVATLIGDQDFLTGTRGEVAAPVAAGGRGHDPQPDAEVVIGGGVVGAAGVSLPAGGLVAALPGELDFEAQVAVGVGGRSGADDDGGLGAGDGGPGVQPAAVAVGEQRAPGDGGPDGVELVAVEVDFPLPRPLSRGERGG